MSKFIYSMKVMTQQNKLNETLLQIYPPYNIIIGNYHKTRSDIFCLFLQCSLYQKVKSQILYEEYS